MDIQRNGKHENQAAVFPYIYGSLSFSMGKKTDSTYTHKWICYVRGANNEDLSYLIKKVVFTLHSSFQNPVREIYQPPYQIQELGWGEFQILIDIHFNHPDMPTIQFSHMLRLHHGHQTGGQTSKKPLCSEVYDEVVFPQIDEHIEAILLNRQKLSNSLNRSEQSSQPQQEENQFAVADQPLKSITQYTKYLTQIDPEDHKNKLQQALRFIKGELSSLEQKMRISDIDIQKVYQQLYGKIQ